MGLSDQLNQEYITAMKAKNERAVSVIRMLKTAIKNQEIESGHELSEEELHAVARRLIKQSQDALQDFERGGRVDLADAARVEIAQLQTYVPAPFSEDQILVFIDECIAETGAKSAADMGKVMGAVMKKIGSCADGRVARALVAKRLSL
ncbi:MAG: GatB/YqeY domain-containing protein [Candidatus Magasanikbacteria bacterium]|nr:GatB/YqeY domain-containing protein [Candidatus Magasanikbacteria bacterium]